jgi:hypothetical protein
MYVDAETFQNTEGGSVCILGNGPSLNKWRLDELDCDTIGINLSTNLIQSKYYVTVAKDRARDVNDGKITALGAVFTNRKALINPDIEQPVVILPMTLADDYARKAVAKQPIFDYDLTKPMRATFGGIVATQVALFLGYDTIYYIGMEGGTLHFTGKHRDANRPGYHKTCFWHVAHWWRNQSRVKIYQTIDNSAIDYFPVAMPPMREA